MDKKFSKINKINDKYIWLKLGFPTERDSATFWDKGTEVLLLSWDKETKVQAKNHPTGLAGTANQNPKSRTGRGTGQGFDILPCDGPGQDFDSLSCPRISHETEREKE